LNEDRQRVDRELFATLGAGLFTNSLWDMLSVAVPLYAVAVGLNASQIGLIVAARSVLPAALSIHGGILIDQIGTRRMLMGVAAMSVLLVIRHHENIRKLMRGEESRIGANKSAPTP